MKIPRCPVCGDCKILLAPIHSVLGMENVKQDIAKLPIACSQCDWRGVWSEVPYVS